MLQIASYIVIMTLQSSGYLREGWIVALQAQGILVNRDNEMGGRLQLPST